MTSLFLILSIITTSVIAVPLQEKLADQLESQNVDAPPTSSEVEGVAVKDQTKQQARKHAGKSSVTAKDTKLSQVLLSALNQDDRVETKTEGNRPERLHSGTKNKMTKKARKHKAIFVNYPVLPQIPFTNIPGYDYNNDYNNDYDLGVEQRTRGGGTKRYQESNIFYIRLPPTPYMFVPGLGYISQPPTYSTANLRPQIPYARPTRPKPVYQQSTNPFIQLPIDFVSNGKPTSVYQWQKKPSKKPTDSPITNLDSLSNNFVSNGKPTSIYQWQTNLKPAKRPTDDVTNDLDKGPYFFNGKPTSFFLLKPDGTTTNHQAIQYPKFQDDNYYY